MKAAALGILSVALLSSTRLVQRAMIGMLTSPSGSVKW